MPFIKYCGDSFEARQGETVLECLERFDKSVPSSCRLGICQTCLLKVIDGDIPSASQRGLKDSYVDAGVFMSCSCIPVTDISIADIDESICSVKADVVSKDFLTSNVMRIRLQPKSEFSYKAGQYVNIVREDGLNRPYSVASLPDDGFLEFHIRHHEQGQMTGWIHRSLVVGDTVSLRGPNGFCFYASGNPDQKILLCGTGTGLAPLYGIVNDAIKHQHQNQVHLFHGALDESGLYYDGELSRLDESISNFCYYPCTLNASASDRIKTGNLGDIILEKFSDFSDWRVYLSGDPETVNSLKKKLFLAGASINDIYSDPFISGKAEK